MIFDRSPFFVFFIRRYTTLVNVSIWKFDSFPRVCISRIVNSIIIVERCAKALWPTITYQFSLYLAMMVIQQRTILPPCFLLRSIDTIKYTYIY